MAASPQDPRIVELLDLEAEQGQPLAMPPAQICALEDSGWIVEPFTGVLLPHPPTAQWPTPAGLATALHTAVTP